MPYPNRALLLVKEDFLDVELVVSPVHCLANLFRLALRVVINACTLITLGIQDVEERCEETRSDFKKVVIASVCDRNSV